jgi:hypothetical protein
MGYVSHSDIKFSSTDPSQRKFLPWQSECLYLLSSVLLWKWLGFNLILLAPLFRMYSIWTYPTTRMHVYLYVGSFITNAMHPHCCMYNLCLWCISNGYSVGPTTDRHSRICWFLSKYPGHFISPLRLSGSVIEFVFGTGGKLNAANYRVTRAAFCKSVNAITAEEVTEMYLCVLMM